MKKIIVLMCIFILSICNIHCKSNKEHEEKIEFSKQDRITNIKIAEINRIIKEIEEFNKSKLPELKKLILENFKKINKEELDSLIIIAEPVFEVNPNYKITKNNSLHSKSFIVALDTVYNYLLALDSNNKTVYPYILYPILKQDTVKISFKIFKKNKLQKYYIEIIDPTEISSLQSGTGKYETMIIKDIDDFDNKFSANYIRIPYDINSFSIDINSTMLQRCIIYKSRIYSLYCIKNKFEKLSIEEILKNHLSEIDDCDIDIEFTNCQ